MTEKVKQCKNQHYVLIVDHNYTNFRLVPYTRRETAIRGSKRQAKALPSLEMCLVLEDCGDHWGLWDGHIGIDQMSRLELETHSDWLLGCLNLLSKDGDRAKKDSKN